MGYFDRKEELKKQAKKHTEYVRRNFAAETAEAVMRTKVYGNDFKKELEEGCCHAEIIVDGLDSAKSLFEHKCGKTAVLNFASYKNPGGKFIEGSSAQEESLCHASNLYNILETFQDYYEWNKKHNNRALYTNRALYSEDVLFFDDSVCVYGVEAKQVKADVITCAAPNFSAASKYAGVSKEDNDKVLMERIRFVLDVAEDNHVETLILGAFGCGVFGQDADTVAKCFQECLKDGYNFKKVYFSILTTPMRKENFHKFEKILQKK